MEMVRELGEFRRFYIQKPDSPLQLTDEAKRKLENGIRSDEYFPRINLIWSGMVVVEAPKADTVVGYLTDVAPIFTFLCVADQYVVMRSPQGKVMWMPYRAASVPATMWMITQLTTEGVRPDSFVPDYGKYREAFQEPVFEHFRVFDLAT